ncbi:MAG TPA: pectin acetylesterase-family hydrolase [Chloroflexia bacterium]
MKKLIICALLLLLAFAFSACSDDKGTPTPTTRAGDASPSATVTGIEATNPLPGGAMNISTPQTSVDDTPGSTPVTEVANEPSLPQLAAGWTKIEPGGETICARGTPYAFWVRPGTVNKLLVYFQGGGGCWNAETCREGSTFFDDAVTAQDGPQYQPGVLDMDNLQNPFKDYYALYMPSCTGDVYMGDKTQTYKGEDGTEVTINHKGFVNGSSGTEWVYEHFSSPESVFVTGCSAGSVGSITFAPYLINHYPKSRVTQLGDSLAYVFDHPVDLQTDWAAHDNFPSWIPDMAEIAPGEFTIARFYTAIARFYPGYTFSQFNSAHDAVQQRFYFAAALPSPTPGPWEDALAASLGEIAANAPNFRSYVAGGDQHCITPRQDFYTREVNGVRLRDWVDDLANGRDVESVHCVQCDAP